MDKNIFLLTILILSIFTLNYQFLDELVVGYLTNSESVYIERVIDGDTVVAEKGSIRLLGINSPERGEKYYSEAKEFLEKEILNKSVQLVFGKDKKDRYNRTLAYIFLDGKNVNLKLVENGLANYYFPSGKDQFYLDFKDSWNGCLENKINLCEPSKNECVDCILLEELNVNSQEIIFYNQCNFSCDLTNWGIKDEGRKKFVFPKFFLDSKKEIKIKVSDEKIDGNILTWKRKTYVWTKIGDTLFLRDSENKLVLWESY